jgi:hypothetical protein
MCVSWYWFVLNGEGCENGFDIGEAESHCFANFDVGNESAHTPRVELTATDPQVISQFLLGVEVLVILAWRTDQHR